MIIDMLCSNFTYTIGSVTGEIGKVNWYRVLRTNIFCYLTLKHLIIWQVL